MAPSTESGIDFTLQSNISLLNAAETLFLTATAKSKDRSTPSGVVAFTQGSSTLGMADLVGSGGISTATLAIAGAKLAQGSGTIAASLNGMRTASITVTVGARASASGAPSISGVTNAASFTSSYAPGAIVSVFGEQLAPSTELAAALPLPLTLGGVAATINGIAAPLWYISPGQINLQAPYQIPPGTATLVLSNNGQTSSTTLVVSTAAPGIFAGQNRGLTSRNTGARGETITLYVTGAGSVSPSIANGTAPSSDAAASELPVPEQRTTVTIGGLPAVTTFTGIPPGVVGIVQINVQIPASIAAGMQPVVVTVGGVVSAAANLLVTP